MPYQGEKKYIKANCQAKNCTNKVGINCQYNYKLKQWESINNDYPIILCDKHSEMFIKGMKEVEQFQKDNPEQAKLIEAQIIKQQKEYIEEQKKIKEINDKIKNIKINIK